MKKRVTRRDFLKLAGTTAVASTLMGFQPSRALAQNSSAVSLLLGSHMDYLQNLAPDYEAEYGVSPSIELVTTPDLEVKLNSSFIARRSPGDVVFLTAALISGMAENGWLEELSEFIDEKLRPEGLLENALTAARYRGGIYGVPITIGAPIMHWNNNLFEAHGLDAEAPADWHAQPGSWDTMLEAAREINDPANNVYGIVDAWAGTHSIFTFGALLQMHGGRFLDDDLQPVMNSEAGVAALAKMVDLLHVEKVIDPATVTYTWVFDASPSYLAGQRGIFFTWPFIAGVADFAEESQLKGRNGFAPNPSVETSASVDGSEFLGVPTFAGNKEGALQYIELATSFENQVKQGALGVWAPVLGPALEHPDVTSALQVAEVIRQSYLYPVDGGFSADRARWVEILTSELSLAFNQSKSPQAALDDAVRLINQSRS
ncbi:MAG: sugar ABC transporter substrate-binding protein [Trueperaceae bacterium]|nr:MAG: sugar ABC transporter substrate-binding protein [Trueperaceae bacterium]